MIGYLSSSRESKDPFSGKSGYSKINREVFLDDEQGKMAERIKAIESAGPGDYYFDQAEETFYYIDSEEKIARFKVDYKKIKSISDREAEYALFDWAHLVREEIKGLGFREVNDWGFWTALIKSGEKLKEDKTALEEDINKTTFSL